MSHRKIITAITLLFTLFIQMALPVQTKAQDVDPASAVWIVLDSLNSYRAANGLGPLQVNANLMAAAQSQADYLASTYDIQSGSDGHVGSGGSRPIDRAAAFGYGGGKEIEVSENWAGLGIIGTKPEEVVYTEWWADAAHQNTMLDGNGRNYADVGVGVARQSNVYYYVIDVGVVVSDNPYVPPSGFGNGVYSDGSQQSFTPLETAAPAADGSVTHKVKEGESLTMIAQSYGVDIDEIRELNGMDVGWVLIYPNQDLIIKPKGSETTPGVRATEDTGEPTPTATFAPTYTPRPQTTIAPTGVNAAPIQEPSSTPEPTPASSTQTLGFVIIGVFGIGLLGFLGMLFRRSAAA